MAGFFEQIHYNCTCIIGDEVSPTASFMALLVLRHCRIWVAFDV
jgi:hypothetical protein